ncbi:M20 family metallopeptidase [uncultured Alistipes sp.]|uniref:M20 metallopeptidase family protein n=1 Tax=uncultured Alistipes sp. TaxID=538949 RepID=UPI00320A6526
MTPVEFRRHLHAHPELSFREHDTAAFIETQLDRLGIGHRRIAQTGVLATIRGTKTPENDKHAVVLRADIDALPITEQNDVPWRSQNDGVMHACGHDVHAAVLFGVVQQLAAAPAFRGTVLALFQPGEECNPGGASLVLAEKPFDGYDIRAVVGEHVESQMEVGTLGFRAGKYMAASDELRFRIHGSGGHGAMRKQLKDPVAAGAEFLTRLLALNGEECVLSIGRVEAAGATNIVPDEVYMEGTLRTFDEQERGIIHRRIGNIAAEIDSRYGVSTRVDISHGYPCVVNDELLVKRAVTLAKADGLKVEMLPLRTTAEDFGFYCRQYPSIFYRLGVGTAAGRSHTGSFNPDERAIDTGIGFMYRLALQILEK